MKNYFFTNDLIEKLWGLNKMNHNITQILFQILKIHPKLIMIKSTK
ncbi:hypothetical protein SAMN04488508_107153 [Aquimarina spongiae]|uniref:Uncharacterized protein n=1 Tax=Aquimarina spongiae TaxID=570521 RepID=A0A1M6I6W8_9FLAO|nr:hypothetical protein SAMN04488508_107153 [Aquimarina spongiae]